MVTGLLGKIIPIAIAGLGIFALANIFARPGQASQSAGALGETLGAFGEGLGSIGTGAQSLLSGIGTGSAQLLNPLWTLKDLFYSNADDSVIIREQARDESNTTMNNPIPNSPSAGAGTSHTPAQGTSTIHFSSGAVSVPSLSAAAKRYYANVGTDVT
jgi:hypothetical protein